MVLFVKIVAVPVNVLSLNAPMAILAIPGTRLVMTVALVVDSMKLLAVLLNEAVTVAGRSGPVASLRTPTSRKVPESVLLV